MQHTPDRAFPNVFGVAAGDLRHWYAFLTLNDGTAELVQYARNATMFETHAKALQAAHDHCDAIDEPLSVIMLAGDGSYTFIDWPTDKPHAKPTL
jgi:hypothetical protein